MFKGNSDFYSSELQIAEKLIRSTIAATIISTIIFIFQLTGELLVTYKQTVGWTVRFFFGGRNKLQSMLVA